MNIPGFTAEASLYRTSRRYRSSASECDGAPSAQSVVAAYIPGPATQHDCEVCENACKVGYGLCIATALGIGGVGCALSIFTFGISCAASLASAATIFKTCQWGLATCYGICNNPLLSPCCPKACSVPGPGGRGCCDKGESCVGSHNPNTRDGCCPVGQECYGNCCAKGEHCLSGGTCSTEPGYFADTPTPPKPPERPIAVDYCKVGYTRCGSTCCAPGLECCSVGGGRVACLTTCVN